MSTGDKFRSAYNTQHTYSLPGENRTNEICIENWNKQQTSRNWRLDRIKFWSQQSELIKYIIYLLTAVLPAIKRVTGDTFVLQQ